MVSRSKSLRKKEISYLRSRLSWVSEYLTRLVTASCEEMGHLEGGLSAI